MSAPAEVIVGDIAISSLRIRARAARLAAGLRSLGVGAGDAVALIAKNDFVCLEASLATQRMDAFVVPINWHWRAAEVGHVILDSAAKVVLAHREYVALMRSLVPAHIPVVAVTPSWESAAAPVAAHATTLDYETLLAANEPLESTGSGRGSSMIYTSGTTGKPKGVRRMPASDAEVCQRGELLALVYNAKPGKTAIVTGPLYHLFSLAVASANFAAGATVVIMRRFEPEEFLRLVAKHHVTTVGVVPTMLVRLLRLPVATRASYDLSSLEYLIHTAAPCPPEIKRATIDWLGPIVWENYGSSETGVITLVDSHDWLAHPGTVGRPALSGEVRIYTAEGTRAAPNVPGDIYLKMHGSPDFTYHRDPDARARVDRDGFVCPGDIGYLDEAGFLYLCDRKSDMLISGGVNIYPLEIEAELLAHPQVVDAAVFGIPDDDLGEVVAAHVQRAAGASLTVKELQEFLAPRLARYKIPGVVVFQAELPREDNGKIYKRALREPYWAGRERRI